MQTKVKESLKSYSGSITCGDRKKNYFQMWDNFSLNLPNNFTKNFLQSIQHFCKTK